MTVRNAESMGTYGSDWEARGYAGKGNVSALLGSLTGRSAIVCGGGAGVFEEMRQARVLLDVSDPVVFAVNEVGMFLPTVDHWLSLHADNLGAWKTVRWLHQHAHEQTRYHSVDARPFIDVVWEGLTPLFALSGYFAMQVAWIMGADRIVLCGCPGTQSPRFFEADAKADFGYGQGPAGSDRSIQEQVEKEMRRVPEFRCAVRSMSGWTAEFFGRP